MKKHTPKVIAFILITLFVVSPFAPLVALAAPSRATSDTGNALNTPGTKANRLKNIGESGVDETSGAFSFSYPFLTPVGKMGIEPSVSISYNSQTNENSPVGYGMTLSLPYIERTTKNGINAMYSDNSYFVSSLGGELVQKPNGQASEYVQKIDDGSYQLYTFANNMWTLTDRSGNTYTFGATVDSRLCDDACTKIARFYLTSVRDMFGNSVRYVYEKKNNYVYPKEIAYTLDKAGNFANKVVFEREVRTDEEISYKTGFKVTLSDRIKSIKAYTDNTLNATLDLTYITGQNSTRSLLASIRESRLGTDNVWTVLPETKLEYTKGADVGDGLLWTQMQNDYVNIDYTGDAKPENLYVGIVSNQYGYVVLDVNGDYIPDMYANTQYSTYMGNMGQSTNTYKPSTTGNLPISTFNFPISYYADQSGIYKRQVNVLDLNADGLQDLVNTTAGLLSDGKGFTGNAAFKTDSLDTPLVDMNGDGLPDKIADYTNPTTPTLNGKYVYLNNGNGWNSTPEMGMKIPTDLKIINSTYGDVDLGVQFADVNLDGLTDIVRSYKTNVSNYWSTNTYGIPQGTFQELYINTGKSFISKSATALGSNYTITYDKNNNVYPTVTSWQVAEGLNPKRTDVLNKVTNPFGARTEVTYAMTANGNLNPNLPINMQVVDEVKEIETVANITESTKYTFEGGKMYYDAQNIKDRRFAGFGKVTTQKGTQKSVKYFHQGDGDNAATYERGDSIHLIGKVYKEELYGGSTLYADTYNIYGVYDYAGQVYKYPKQTVSSEYDAVGGKRTTAIAYDYDLVSRLPKKTIDYGEVTFDIASNTITDVGSDLVNTILVYTTKRPQKLLSTEKYDKEGKFLDKMVTFYDGLPFGYVEKGLPTEERNYSSESAYVKTTTSYNAKGLPEKVTDQNGNITSFVYNENNNVTEITNALGQKSLYIYDKSSGAKLTSTNPNGASEQSIYDGFGNAKEYKATSPKSGTLERVFTASYNYGLGMSSTKIIYADGEMYKTLTNTFDSFGREIQSTETNTQGSIKAVDTKYNTLGQIISVSYPYDKLGILSIFNPAINTNFTYDDIGRVVKVSQGGVESYTSYKVGEKTVSDNTPLKHTKTYKFNSQNKLTDVVEGNNGTNITTSYKWSQLGNLVNINDAEGNVRNMTYDGEGRLLTQEDLHAPGDNMFGVYKYEYDALGNLIKKINPKGDIFDYAYDALYRPISETGPGVANTYTYDACDNGLGALCKVENSDYTQNITYTKSGAISSEEKQIDSYNFKNYYAYNALGQVTTITLPDSSRILYTYDKNGKQKTAILERTVAGAVETTNIINDAKFNIDGTDKEVAYGNGMKSCSTYSTSNSAGTFTPRLSDIYVVKNDQCDNASNSNPNALYYENLGYNLSGSIISINAKWQSDTSSTLSKFTYDELDRLTSIERLENGVTTLESNTYSSIGNILSKNGVAYSYDGGDYKNPHAASLIGTARMAYDLNGNILSDGKNQYEWNSKNKMTKSESENSVSEYVYDIKGERIKETVKLKQTGANAESDASKADYTDEELFSASSAAVPANSPKVYISQTAYNNFVTLLGIGTPVTSKAITDMFVPIYNSSFVSSTCQTFKSAYLQTCLRETALKAFYVKVKKEKGISLSFGTLVEIWGVFKGTLTIPTDTSMYTGVTTKTYKQVLSEKDYTTKTWFYMMHKTTPSASYFQDQTYNTNCALYNFSSAKYYCAFVFESIAAPSYEGYTLSKAYFDVTTGNALPDTYLKMMNLKDWNANTTNKFTVDETNAVSAKFTENKSGFYLHRGDVTNIFKSWANPADAGKNGIVIFTNTDNDVRYMNSAHSGINIDSKPSLTLEYIFTGTMNTFNPGTTVPVASEDVDAFYQNILSGQIVQTAKQIATKYVSEATYAELVNAKLTSANKFEMLFEIARESDYVKAKCPTNGASCIKLESMRFVAGYLNAKYNIKLSTVALEELWSMKNQDLLMPEGQYVYEKYAKGGYVFNTNLGNNSIYYSETGDYSRVAYTSVTAGNFRNTAARVYFQFDALNTSSYPSFPIGVKAVNPITGQMSAQLLQTDPNKPGTYTVDITDAIGKSNLALANPTTNYMLYVYFQAKGNPSIYGMMSMNNMRMYMADFQYKNDVNDNTKVTPTITQASLNSEVYAYSDKNLAGFVFKEKKIPSLFANPKLISMDALNELLGLGITYTNLVIYDRLIDYSFTPYASCALIDDDQDRAHCEKEIFVKYVFAIVKYEKDKEMSPATLDEVFEAMQGNLTVPNNPTEYVEKTVKTYTISNTSPTTSTRQYNYGTLYGTPSSTTGVCKAGYFSNGLNNYSTCQTAFTLPQEVIDRKSEVSKATIDLSLAEGTRTFINNNSGTPVAYSASLLLTPVTSGLAPVYSNSESSDATLMRTVNSDTTYMTDPLTVNLAAANTFDVTKIIKGYAFGALPNFGLRLAASGQVSETIASMSSYNLQVTYSKDKDSVNRTYYTPMILNPRDVDIEKDVLRVLARIDRDIITTSNTIISQETYNEIKTTPLVTAQAITDLFNLNEKLQKDETLAAVWNAIFTTYNIKLTREALEELFLVWTGKLAMPLDADAYLYATVQKLKYTYDPVTWKVYSVNSVGAATQNQCNGSANSSYCVILPQTFAIKPYVGVTVAKLTTNINSGYGDTVAFNAATAPIPAGTLFAGLPALSSSELASYYNNTNTSGPFTIDLSPMYQAISAGKYAENGIIIKSQTYYNNLSCLNGSANATCFIEYDIVPKFTVFNRSNLENLSVVSAVKSVRDLSTDDLLMKTRFYVSPETLSELAQIGVTNLSGVMALLPMHTPTDGGEPVQMTSISHGEKLDVLKAVYMKVLTEHSKMLSREALEEIYYIVNGKIGFKNTAFDAGVINPNAISVWFKSNGAIASNDKKKSEVSGTVFLTEFQPVLSAGRNGATDGAYAYSNVTPAYNYFSAQSALTNNAVTYSAWIKTTRTDFAPVVTFGSTLQESNNQMYNVISSGKASANLLLPNGTSLGAYGTKPVNDDKWHKLDFVYANNPNGSVKIYVDGLLDASGTIPTAYNLTNASQKTYIGAQENWYYKTMNAYFTGTIDDVKVYNKALSDVEVKKVYDDDIAGVDEIIKIDNFSRASLGMLDPIEVYDVPIASWVEDKVDSNITYTPPTTDTTVKYISDESIAELALGGVTTKSQIVAMMDAQVPNSTNVLTTLAQKDSKMYSMWKKVKDTTTFDLSREALEEAYLVYAGKAFFPPASPLASSLTETNTWTASNSKWTMSTNILGANICTAGFVNGATRYVCTITYDIPQKEFYSVRPKLYFTGASSTNYGSLTLTIGGVDATSALSTGTADLSAYAPTNGKVTIEFKYTGPYNTTWTINGLKVDNVYTLLPTAKLDRFSMGDLALTSTMTEIKNAYDVELGLAQPIQAPVPVIPPTPSATPPVPPTPPAPLACTLPQILNTAGDACVDEEVLPPTPSLTCTAPQVLNATSDACVDPDPLPPPPSTPLTCTLPQVLNPDSTACIDPVVLPPAPPAVPPVCTLPQVLNSDSTACVDPAITPPVNPYNYPYTIDSLNIFHFILPDGTITEDPLTLPMLALAQKVKDVTSKLAEPKVYTKYYPSPYYEFDTRGFITINIPFNGKIVSTMKYNIATLEQPKKFTELSYIVHNYLGTPVVITDKDGNAKQSIKRNVYGEVTTNTINTDEVLNTSFGYTGHKYDADSNLTYAHARYLNTNTSVFLSQDPLFWSIPESYLYDPQEMNAYSYVKNNPINFADPTGESLAPTKSTSIKDLFSKNIPSYATRAPIISPIVLGPARPSTTLTPPTPESKLLTTSKASNTQSGNASTTKYNSTKVGEYNTNFANIVAQQVGKKYKQATDSVGPDVFDCSGIIVYAIRQTVNPNFPRINADTFYKKYTSPSASPDVGTVNFYDYEPVGDADRGTIDHMTTNIEGGMMIHPSSSAGIVQSKAQNYMDSYTNKKGGVIYSNRQLNWALIIGE